MAATEEAAAAAATTTTTTPAEETKPAAEAATTTKKLVIAYYSRTGTTQTVVDALVDKLKAKGEDPEVLKVVVDQSNEGYFYSAFQAFRGKTLDIKNETKKIGPDATEVWICGPVHAWTVCAALKKFMEVNCDALKSDKVTINTIAVMKSKGEEGFFQAVEEATGKKISKKTVFKEACVKDAAQLSAGLDSFLNPKAPEEPKAEEPKAEEPKAEEPKAEEPKAEEPKAEEPKAEEPKAEEPKADSQ